MSLPMKAVDRLFERMAATYLSQWTRQFEHVPMADAKTAWAHELAPFAGRLDSLAWALENLPTKVPNVIEFKQLCRQAPRPAEPPLPSPKADPARVASELSKLADVKKAAKASVHAVDPKGWAKTILAREKAGEKLNPTSLRFAREALRVHLQPVEA
jgi:hypothetical protein